MDSSRSSSPKPRGGESDVSYLWDMDCNLDTKLFSACYVPCLRDFELMYCYLSEVELKRRIENICLFLLIMFRLLLSTLFVTIRLVLYQCTLCVD